METGLDYFGTRYYSSLEGRFTSVDPISGTVSDPQRWNMYVYVTNNPLGLIDPSGMSSQRPPKNPNTPERKPTHDEYDMDRQAWVHPRHSDTPYVISGYRRVVSLDKKEVTNVWVNDPNVHDVPNNYRYVDTMGNVIQLYGDDKTNFHSWGYINSDGSAVSDKMSQAPSSYTGWRDIERALVRRGSMA